MTGLVIEKNTIVSITYRILQEDGEVAEQCDIPVDYMHGVVNSMFEKVESALQGKTVGDTIEVILDPEHGFGSYDPGLTFTDVVDNVPPEYRLIGARPSFQNEHGEVFEMTVTKIVDGLVTVDGNHPFAGKTMTIKVDVAGVRKATSQELAEKQPASSASNTLQ